MGDGENGARITPGLSGPGLPDILDTAAGIDEDPIEVKENRGTAELGDGYRPP
jgi:hypothetical protein